MSFFNKRKPIRDLSGLPDDTKVHVEKQFDGKNTKEIGINGQNMAEPVPIYDQSASDTVFMGRNNSLVTLGQQRFGPKANSSPGSQVGEIRMTAGLMGATKEGPKSNIYVGQNPNADAASLFLTQGGGKVDKNLGLAEGGVGLAENGSSAFILADAIRFRAREGLKIVTGTTPDERNSSGEKIVSTYGIDLIAGNDDHTVELEPIPKGTRLVQALKNLNDRVDELNGLYSTLVLAIAKHTHFVGAVPTTPSPDFAVDGTTQCFIPSYGHKLNLFVDEQNALQPYGFDWINSRWNKVN